MPFEKMHKFGKGKSKPNSKNTPKVMEKKLPFDVGPSNKMKKKMGMK